MCDPTSLAVASLATTVVGTGVSAYGQMQQGKSEAAAASYRSAVLRNNQILAQRQADDARERGAIEARQKRDEVAQLKGRQRAILAANGVLVDTGSALDITSDTAGLGKLDELRIRNNAEREALGYEAQGMNFSAEAGLSDASGKAARSAGMMAAGGTVLSGFGSVAQKWYGFKRERVL